MDLAQHRPNSIVDQRISQEESLHRPDGWPITVLHSARAYAHRVISGVLSHQEEIDALIQERASLWPLAQMSAVDRNVLRIGLYESLFGNAKVPLRTAINEAVELAKLFGSEASPRFVNGVLGRAVELRSASREQAIAEAVAPPAGPEPTSGIIPSDAVSDTQAILDPESAGGIPEHGDEPRRSTEEDHR